jgi:phosphoglucosamine mutase
MKSGVGSNARLFGTDGIRGTANRELTPELAMKVGWAAATVLGERQAAPLFLIGKDTRLSGDMLEAALVAGICSAGGNCRQLGVLPTPAVAYLTRRLGADAGVVISASHNPAEDNGIKFFNSEGFKLPDEVEERIEELVLAGLEAERPGGTEVGWVETDEEAQEEYLSFLVNLFSRDLSRYRIVVDCAHGAAYRLAPRMLREAGAEVVAIHAEPDGTNINRECGATRPGTLRKAVLEHGAHLGLAFDGDADRLIAVDERGELVDGDQVMAICAVHMKEKGTLKGNRVVATVMSNLGFHRAMRREGIGVVVTQVGDRYVLEKMLEEGLNLGGEQSGHIIFLDRSTTGDGLVTAAHLLEALAEAGEPLSSLARIVEKVPQYLVNVPVRHKEALEGCSRLWERVSLWEEALGEEGRILVRASGTEQVVRVMVEDLDAERGKRVAEDLAALVERELN